MFMILAVVAVFAVGAIALTTLLKSKPDVQETREKTRKPKKTKQEKIQEKASKQSKKSIAAVDQATEQATAKAEKKRLKEKERKARKKAEAAEVADAKKQAEEEAAAALAKHAEPESTHGKKKKKKNKKKKHAAEEVHVEPEPEPVEDGWVTIEKKERAAPTAKNTEQTDEIFKEDMMIEQEHFSLIIGSGGSTLNMIQDECGVNIKIPRKERGRDYTWISGSDKAGIEKAKQNILQLVEKGYCDLTDPGRVDGGINVPKKMQSMIVGPKGATINALRDATGADIKMPNRDSESLFVIVTGDADAVARATEAIEEIVEKGFSSITHPGWTSQVVQVPGNQLRNVIGPGGATIQGIQKETETKVEIPKSGNSLLVDVVVKGEPQQIEVAITSIQALIEPEVEEEIPYEWTKEAVMNQRMNF